uniref:Uncharacterized protein n=1 Tax=Ditylenchus dipsaci TaxID=166011 RepID=A0A915ELN1_9BILA
MSNPESSATIHSDKEIEEERIKMQQTEAKEAGLNKEEGKTEEQEKLHSSSNLDVQTDKGNCREKEFLI